MTTDTTTTDTATEVKTRTVTLTGRAPVIIVEADWGVIARAGWHDGEIRSQANQSCFLVVRQHDDGRALVYGGYDSQWRGDPDLRGGELLAPGADIPAAISRVGYTVGAQRCIADCIADLPAEEI